MQLNHLNLCVDNVPEAIDFFETHFGFRCTEKKGEAMVAILTDKSDFTLVLSNFDKSVQPVYPEAFHVGFLVESVEEVQAMHKRLACAGVALQDEPRQIRGRVGFYGYAPGGVLFEVSSKRPVGV